MHRCLIALLLFLSLVGCDSENDSEGSNPCLLGGGTAAEVWRDGQKIELLATAALSKSFAMVDYHPVWVEAVTVTLSIEKYGASASETCVQRLTFIISNPGEGEGKPDTSSEDEEMTYTATYGWGNSDELMTALDNVATGRLTDESKLLITEYGDGFISGTFTLVWGADPLTLFDGVALDEGRFTNVPVQGSP